MVIAIFFLILGINIFYTKSIPQGHNGEYYGLYIGNWSYVLGGIIFIFGLYLFITSVKIGKKKD